MPPLYQEAAALRTPGSRDAPHAADGNAAAFLEMPAPMTRVAERGEAVPRRADVAGGAEGEETREGGSVNRGSRRREWAALEPQDEHQRQDTREWE